jgi:hypothetical protein
MIRVSAIVAFALESTSAVMIDLKARGQADRRHCSFGFPLNIGVDRTGMS